MTEALKVLANAPIPRDPPEVLQAGKLFVFADPELEQLTAAEKLMVRMGPRNAHLVQKKARELLSALGERRVAGTK
jgi:hypothetical protein